MARNFKNLKVWQIWLVRRRKMVVAASVAFITAGIIGVIGNSLIPGFRAKLSSQSVESGHKRLPGSDPIDLQGNGVGGKEGRKLLLGGANDSIESARQLAQAVVSTIRNFYVDSERVTDAKLAGHLKRVLARVMPTLDVAIEGRILVVKYSDQTLKYPLSRAGLVEAVTAASVLMAEEKSVSRSETLTSDTLTSAETARQILNALVAELDPHSSVMSPQAYNELRQGTEGSFGGLGVLVGIRDRVLTVIKPLPNSPALRAGVLPGDKIVRLNNQPTFGMALEDLMEFMRGVPGTHVTMRILRAGEKTPFDFVVKREIIQVDSVTATPRRVGGFNVLHLAVETFSAKTSREILSAMKAFKRDHNAIDGLILDLRANPGGLLDQAIQVADLFLEDGVIVSTRGRREEVEVAGKGYDEIDFPLVVLLDQDSASASEIVAGALQDQGRAVIVGRPSFGKGSVQTVFELPFEIALKLTIARYFTPANTSIQNVGILPDLWLQPVSGGDVNINLLGADRYRNEGFLIHHLDGVSTEPKYLAMVDRKLSLACCAKAYHLQESKSENGDVDQDIGVAESIIASALSEHQQSGGDHRHWRSSKWNAMIAGDSISKIVKGFVSKSGEWLASKFGIDWLEPNQSGTFASLEAGKSPIEFQIQPLVSKTVRPGIEARFLWTIRNTSKRDLRRVSVYLRGSGVEGDTIEVLVGSVAAGAVRSGEIVATVPNPSDSSWLVDIGLAIDAWPVSTMVQQYVYDFEPGNRADVQCVAEFRDEQDSVGNGILDPGENASIKVSLVNNGNIDAEDLNVTVINLGGSSVGIKDGLVHSGTLSAGQELVLSVPLEFAGVDAMEDFDLGVAVEWKGMASPVFRHVTLPVRPIGGRIGELMIETLE